MEALFLLIPLSLGIVAFAIWIFFGAAESGQFDDLDGPALRILHDDDRAGQPSPAPASLTETCC
jgi:cbb3-type cytochrome oxidase maturation protein